MSMVFQVFLAAILNLANRHLTTTKTIDTYASSYTFYFIYFFIFYLTCKCLVINLFNFLGTINHLYFTPLFVFVSSRYHITVKLYTISF